VTGEKENGVSESDNRKAVERFFKAADAQDWTTMKELYHSDAGEEWPQSGERLVGVDNVMAVNENYPGHPEPSGKRILGAGDLVIGEAELDYSGTKYNLVSVFEFVAGKIKNEVDYFCEPFEAETWRAQWVDSGSEEPVGRTDPINFTFEIEVVTGEEGQRIQMLWRRF
jgi:hypothetical protein